MFKALASAVFGTKNDRELKKYKKRLKQINSLESKYEVMSDEELKSSFAQLKSSVEEPKDLDVVLNDSFAITREASKRVLNMRHFDVQILGGLVLNDGRIAEMKTGEGKTLVATLAVALNAMLKKGVHVITVNDYLAQRDGLEMSKLYSFLGYTTGIIIGKIDDEQERKAQYSCDITYGTNNEFGFDYLRDNMRYTQEDIVQKYHQFAIVDEVDSILIDEARTPLIISGPTNKKQDNYVVSNGVALKLEKETHFTIDEKNRVILLTDAGVEKAQELFGVENLYDMRNAILSHQLDQALKANYLFEKDVDYVVKESEVIIVDEFTGRLSEGRRFSEGLHQALEAKEGVAIKEESQTLADITFQNYFRLYSKLSGMTGTAQTEAAEFSQIYTLEVISIPTNLPIARLDKNDLIYKTQKEKFDAVVKKVSELYKKGQPVLVGTISIEQSEYISKELKRAKVPHNVLNAKQHEKEAQIILDAGKQAMVTIATNMAGRGVDIKLTQEVKDLGGLFILGTERHESRRIDNQLRGRSGRQGDAGESQFFLSLEDNLLRIFGSDKIKSIMEKLGVEEGEFIESKMVTRAVENAQKKVESMHFESRKHLLEYDDVANSQRKLIYKFRRELLDQSFDLEKKINDNREDYITHLFGETGIIKGLSREDFDIDKLTKIIKEELNANLNIDDLVSLDFDELYEKTVSILKAEFDTKFELLGKEQSDHAKRVLYLRILDDLWREHLYQMDVLKTGIGLRSYNQKDPLTEYKKDSYMMFNEMVSNIKYQVTKTLHLVQFKFEKEEEEKHIDEIQEALENEQDLNYTRNLNDLNQNEIDKKIPRNSICPCGSGKKYKQCCGKSGPKKGILAE